MPDVQPQYEVVWPLTRRAGDAIGAVDPMGSLNGRRIAFLWDYLYKGDQIFDAIKSEIAIKYTGVEYVDYQEFGNIQGQTEEIVLATLTEKLRDLAVDGAIVGVGACGACTPAVMRTVAQVERAGVRSVAIIGAGFYPHAKAIAKAEGLTQCTIAKYPGVIMMDPQDVFENNVREKIVPAVLSGLTGDAGGSFAVLQEDRLAADRGDPAPWDIVARGSLDEVMDTFETNTWSDALPFVPPTRDKVRTFLDQAGREPDEVLGVLAPARREATVMSVAVNAVMAGARPEYMPLLVALVECLADPLFRIQDAGATPGWEPLVIVSGKVVKDLDFNYSNGAMRIGRRANTTVGRFCRLYMRNIAGLLPTPHTTDQAAFGLNFNIALAENGDALDAMGWPGLREDEGFGPATSTVSVQSVTSISTIMHSVGTTPEQNLHTIAPVFRDAVGPWACYGAYKHEVTDTVLAMAPTVAAVIAAAGWSKDDVREYLRQNMTYPTALVNEHAYASSAAGRLQDTPLGRRTLVEMGIDPAAVDDDHDVEVPALPTADRIAITVAGNPSRNQSRAFVGNRKHGRRVTRVVPDL